MLESPNMARRLWLRDQAQRSSAEKVDVTPVEVPAEMRAPPTWKEEMQRYVRYELSRKAEERGLESFEEFNDFEVDEEDPEWESEYELMPEQEVASFDEFVDDMVAPLDENTGVQKSEKETKLSDPPSEKSSVED